MLTDWFPWFIMNQLLAINNLPIFRQPFSLSALISWFDTTIRDAN